MADREDTAGRARSHDKEIQVDRSKVNKTNRAGSTQKSRSASSRPQSATAAQRTRTSTGRPLSREQSGKAHSAKSSQNQAKHPANANRSAEAKRSGAVRGNSQKNIQNNSRKNGQKNRGKNNRNNVRLNPKTVIPAAVIVGLLLALAVTCIMRASLLKVHQISEDYNMGDTFDIKNFYEASSTDTYIECDAASFAPEKLGKYKVKFTVRRGRLSKTKTAKINVVDVVNPYIYGPDEITVKTEQDINWSDYYSVTDADPDIQSKLTSVNEIDTGKARSVNATLTVTDWAGNSSSKNITVVITDGEVTN